MKPNTQCILECPYCKTQYHFNEIFYPKDLFGHFTQYVKDDNGKLIAVFGEDSNLKENFICEKCNKEFKAEIHVSFETHALNDDDWTEA